MALPMEIPMMRKNSMPIALWRLVYCFALFILLGQVAGAADLDLELEIGIGHTDNITRVPDTLLDPAIDDTIYNVGLSLAYEKESARSEVDIRAALSYVEYKDGPFDNETLPGLDASALFRINERSLRWFILGNIGQQTIDPFEPVTPGNRQNITYITTGPSVFIPLGTRFSTTADAWYSVIRFEEQPQDNDRIGAQLALTRQINTNRSISLNVQGERTEFDLELAFPLIDNYEAYFRFETEGSRNELTVDLGWNTSERSGTKFEAPLVNLEWLRQVSSRTNFMLAAGTRISDMADNFRGNQSYSADITETQNQQSTTEPFTDNFARLSVGFSSTRSAVAAALSLSEQEYDQHSEFNRLSKGATMDFSRQLGNSWEIGLFGAIHQYDYDVRVRQDDELRYGASLTWRQLRTVEVELQFERSDRDSTDETSVYTENRGHLSFRYIPRFGQ